jgi:hypothetical protein
MLNRLRVQESRDHESPHFEAIIRRFSHITVGKRVDVQEAVRG